MKFLRVLLILVLVVAAAYFIAALAGPKNFDIERTRVINATPEAIMAEVVDFQKWSGWSYWEKTDSTIVNSYSDAQGVEGASMSWTSDMSGPGKMTLDKIHGTDSVEMSLIFDGFEPSDIDWKFTPVEGGTEVSVSMFWDIPFMMRPMTMMMGGEASTITAYDEGLADLAEIAEAKPKLTLPDLAVTEEEIGDTHFIGIKHDNLEHENLTAELYGTSFGRLLEVIGDPSRIAGAPMNITHRWDEESMTMDIEISMPLAEPMEDLPEDVSSGIIPAGKSVYAMHMGAYENMDETYDGLMQYMAYHGLEPRWSPVEYYVTDPGSEPDTTKWQTKIVFPVQ